MSKKLVVLSGKANGPEDLVFEENLFKIGKGIDNEKFEIWYDSDDIKSINKLTEGFKENQGLVFNSNEFINFDFNQYFQDFNLCNLNNSLTKNGDIFLIIPNGVGSISQILDLISSKQNFVNTKIVLYSYNYFFKNITNFILENIQNGNINTDILSILYIFEDYDELIPFLNSL